MSFSIDVNILVYSYNLNSVFYHKAKNFLEASLAGPESIAIPWPVLHGFLRISTNPSIFDKPLTPSQAVEVVQRFLEIPIVSIIGEMEGFWNCYHREILGLHLRGNLLSDALIAGIMESNGVRTLYTNDRDFLRFKGLKVIDPFETSNN